jgi:polar amino acid transport system substrate-binding protein
VSNHRRSGLLLAMSGMLALWLAGPSAQAAAAAAETPASARALRLASLEWLPYVGPQLADNGVAGVIAANVARQFGYDVRIDYFPWKRAMQVGGEDPGFAGYFPAYYTEERARSCWFSQPMARSTLGLAYLRNAPLHWEHLADLEGMRIGVVAGYSNGREFDELAKAGRLQIDPSPGDAFNLKKLLAGRVRVAVVDRMVMRYLLLTDPELKPERERIAFHETPLAELTLHVCFQRTPAGQRLQEEFDAALKRVDIDKIENAYFQQFETPKPAAGR